MGSSNAFESFAPLVVVGPSGVGKGTLIAILMKEYPGHFALCVSTTTRPARPGEVDGQHYHFSEKEAMQKAIKEGKFLESAKVHTDLYGTSLAALEAVESSHRIAILDLDRQGAKNVKAKIPEEVPDANFLFLSPPSMEVLEQRLRGRGTEDEHKIQVRLKNAPVDLDLSKTEGFFDSVIVADDGFKEALPSVKAWLEQVYPQLKERWF
jgi:guanylate kinase